MYNLDAISYVLGSLGADDNYILQPGYQSRE
jgi:hypothetical protein